MRLWWFGLTVPEICFRWTKMIVAVSLSAMLENEFLKPPKMLKYRIAKSVGVPAQRIGAIVAGRLQHRTDET
jgi:plasmid maintenance system antidote protein VapI